MTQHAALFLILVLSWSSPAGAALPEGFGRQPEDLLIRVVTFGPGREVHQFFGHSALWVQDTRLGADALYSYGMFSFGRGFELQFLQERPTFWAGRVPVQSSFALYQELDRSISVQELNLTVEQRRRLFERLEQDVRPENRSYKYHYFDNNCATRVRDVLDVALGGALHAGLTGPARASYREHLRRFAQQSLVVDLLLLLWLNDSVDAPMTRWQASFMPQELARGLAEATYEDGSGRRVQLVSRSYDEFVSRAPPVPEFPEPLQGRAFLLGAAVATLALLLAYLRGRSQHALFRVLFGAYHALFGLTLGAAGTVGCLMMTLTEHTVARGNENQLLANPLTLALLPLGLLMAFGHEGAERWARRCVYVLVLGSVLAVALKALPAFHQDNRVPLALLLVANLGLGAAHGWLGRQRGGVTASPREGLPPRSSLGLS